AVCPLFSRRPLCPRLQLRGINTLVTGQSGLSPFFNRPGYDTANHPVAVLAQTLGPCALHHSAIAGVKNAPVDHFKTCVAVAGLESRIYELDTQRRKPEPLDFCPVTVLVEAEHDFEQSLRGANAPKISEHGS